MLELAERLARERDGLAGFRFGERRVAPEFVADLGVDVRAVLAREARRREQDPPVEGEDLRPA